MKDNEVVDPTDFYDENWLVVTTTQGPGDDDTTDSDAQAEADAQAQAEADGTADGGSADGGATSADASDSSEGTETANGSDSANGRGDANAGGDLPRTGADLVTTIGIAAAIIALGAGLVWSARRRRI